MRVTKYLILLNIIVFIIEELTWAFGSDGFTLLFALTPSLALKGYVWQFFTYMFLHADIWHITVNMFVLFMFGPVMEDYLGEKRFLTLYFVSGIGSAVMYMLLSFEPNVLMLGASGAVFGVLAGFAIAFPKERLILFPIPFPIRAIYLIVLLAVAEFTMGIFGSQRGIANFGHFGGILTGIALLFYWKNSSRKRIVRDYQFFWE
ncbi:MAG: rhomboid family intramembrane serine protease [Candidatus Aenigmatarchaeota archaeon]|nr:MAG: rhomboid family intramembrane serine protease [Candidatus Aenigmarchaeota archaeon]RLJ08968.1 MAG: rhomboid family intramembrane serine protease [Candidatus Aenigmarchaeota archaeon]